MVSTRTVQFISRTCPLCDDKSDLTAVGWADGQTQDNDTPKLIHGVNANVFLISQIYSCSLGHKLYWASSISIIKQDLCCLIPFCSGIKWAAL